jgi:membrane-associated phospholipid phosphatase
VVSEAGAGRARRARGTDARWLWPLWVLVGAFLAVTLLRSLSLGIPLRDPQGDILRSRVAISLGLFVLYVPVDAALRSWRGGARLRGTWSVIRSRWTPRRLLLAMGALAAYHLTYFCYKNLKSWDVLLAPRDAMLLDVDRWLFFGHSPAALLHHLLGDHVAAWVLAYWYETFGTLVLVSIVAPVVFPTRIRDGYVAIASGVWVWILGTASYYLIPTLGPFASAPREFAALPHTMIQDTQARYLAQRAHMLADPQAPDAFAQISAFASLHVGVTTVIWLMTRYYGLRKISRVLGIFLIGTILATVYLGWHFFVDDVAGLAIGFAACWLGTRMVYPRGRVDDSGSPAGVA